MLNPTHQEQPELGIPLLCSSQYYMVHGNNFSASSTLFETPDEPLNNCLDESLKVVTRWRNYQQHW
jgi:hypothetical protein